MDRQGYEGGTALAPNTGSGKSMGQKIKEHIPGTEESRMREASKAGTGSGTGVVDTPGFGHDMGHSGYPHTSDLVESSRDHTGNMGRGHGYTGLSQGHQDEHKPLGQTIKENIPGTEEHKLHAGAISSGAHLPGHDTAGTGTSYGYGHTGDMGYGQGHTGPVHGVAHTHAHAMGHDTSSYERSYEHDAARTGTSGMMGAAGVPGTMHSTGATHPGVESDNKSMGQRIKEAIPGTREHEAKKMTEGRF